MKKIWQIVIPIALVIITLVVYAIVTRDKESEPDIVKVEKGVFEVVVTSMGELEALESMNITIPEALQNHNIRIRSMTITDIVKEGTVVKKGDYVATLNPAEVEEQLKDRLERLDLYEVDLENVKIDTSLVLSEARDGIRQMNDQMLDREIKLDQSIYESKAVQRQAQINLEVAQRNLEQRQRNYIQLKRKHQIRVSRALERVNEQKAEIEVMEQLKRDLRIKAPGPGLVVFGRGHDGQKIKIGSQVNRWDPLIATLPDLSSLQSVAYVKEIDIAKIRTGLPVRLKIDAFPESEFKGVIKRVANVGQEMTGQFLTGFKVEIKVDPAGKTLLPGMTSTNNIVVSSVNDVLMVPRKALHSSEEGLFVYKRDGLSVVKQQIKTGGENDTYIWVTGGLQEGERIYLHEPLNKDDAKMVKLEN
jgi:RND family efflux transporter MFP subunit